MGRRIRPGADPPGNRRKGGGKRGTMDMKPRIAAVHYSVFGNAYKLAV
jgi:hypothetical protein